MTYIQKVSWILEVFDDLRDVFEQNELPASVEKLEELKQISRWEMYAKSPTTGATIYPLDFLEVPEKLQESEEA